MKPFRLQISLVTFLGTCLLAVLMVGLVLPAGAQTTQPAPSIRFEANHGQAGKSVKFLAQGRGLGLLLSPHEAILTLNPSAPSPTLEQLRTSTPVPPAAAQTVHMQLAGSNPNALSVGLDALPGDLTGSSSTNPVHSHSGRAAYAGVRFTGVYPGVDLVYYGNHQNQLEYDFLLQPWADPGQIRMNLAGTESVTANANGDLDLHLATGDISMRKPVAYQQDGIGLPREMVPVSYQLQAGINGAPATVTLAMGSYDHSRPLVIDPVITGTSQALQYSQYLTVPNVAAIALDASGNAYVAGYLGSGFSVTEFNPAGTQIYSLTIGSGQFYPTAIAVDSAGNAYVAGSGNGTLPTSTSSYQRNKPAAGGQVAFLVKVASGGSSVPYATYLAGTDGYSTYATSIAVDSSGYPYLAGYTDSQTFPVTTGVYQKTHLGGAGPDNGFVAKFNPTAAGAASLLYSTFLGPASTDVNAIAVDGSGNAYLASYAPYGFPITSGAFQYIGSDSANGGAYVTELNPTATAVVYSAYLGYASPAAIAVDGSGATYVTGKVLYDDFPTTPGAYQTTYPGGFVTELAPGGASELYSTFLGGPSSYVGNNVLPASIALPPACASNCPASIAGWTSTTDFPIINGIQAAASTSGNSAFLVQLAPGGASANFSTYLSGLTSAVYPNGFFGYIGLGGLQLSLDAAGDTYFIAITAGGDFPITVPAAPAASVFAKIVPSASPFLWGIPNAVNFSSQPVGVSTATTAGTQTVQLRNLSSTPAAISSIVVSPSSIFSESDNCAGAIPAGGSCTLSIDFTPGGSGARVGSVTVSSNASNSPFVLALTGTGTDQPYLVASPSAVTFGPTSVSAVSAAQTITVTNVGDTTAAVQIYNTYSTDFYELSTCPTVLQPGKSCSVVEVFAPSQPGLRQDTLTIYAPTSCYTQIPLTGEGIVAGASARLAFSPASVDFGDQLVGTPSSGSAIYFTNNGNEPVVVQSITAAGDFAVTSNSCGAMPIQILPQQYCYVNVTFTPTATSTRTGSLTLVDDDPASPYILPLTGTGLPSSQVLEFFPSTNINFPDQPVGNASGSQLLTTFNLGTAPVTIDRVLVSGPFQISYNNCPETVLNGSLYDGAYNPSSPSYSYCTLYITFTPTAIGTQTGAVTIYDSSPGSPHVINLSGNGIPVTGSVSLTPNALNFGPQVKGVTSTWQYSYLSNPGDTPINVTSISAGTSDFAVTYSSCGSSFTLPAGSLNSCYVAVAFTPTVASAAPGTTRTGTLTVVTSGGTVTSSLTGIGLTSSLALGATPTSYNFGSVITGQGSGVYSIYLRNTGTAPIAFTDNGSFTGTNVSDFYVASGVLAGNQLAPGSVVTVLVYFTPGAAGARSATLTFHSNAAAVAVTLAGTGVSALPASTAYPAALAFNLQPVGTTSGAMQITFQNNSTKPVVLGNISYTGTFITAPGGNNDNCSGQTVPANSNCAVYVAFAPNAVGYQTGTLVFKNSSGTTLYTAALSGYAPAAAPSAYLDPSAVSFPETQVVNLTSPAPYQQEIVFYNSGNVTANVGNVTGTNLGAAPANEFSIISDGCSGTSVPAYSNCAVTVSFTPSAAGARSGTLVLPLTYAYSGGASTSLTATLSGNAVPEKNTAALSPAALSFLDTALTVTATSGAITLTNTGNAPITVGNLSGTNLQVGATANGEFSLLPASGGSDGCSGGTLPPGSVCVVAPAFTPSATGTRTGAINFPVTFTDNSTRILTASLTGNGVPNNRSVQITPLALQFPSQIKGTASSTQYVTVLNNGNVPVTIGTNAISSDFGISSDGCSGLALQPAASCSVILFYKPSVTGPETGTLTLADNAAGGPHTVALSGTGILSTQQIVLSQTAVSFGNQATGYASVPATIVVTNQGDTTVPSFNATLAGTSAAMYVLNNSCSTSLPARSSCSLTVTFNPPANASGPQPASISITTALAAQKSLSVGLSGNAVAPGPAASLTPAALTFANQNLGTRSKPQKISVTNTGTANLIISALSSSNSAEFPVSYDACSGATLMPRQSCTAQLRFFPAASGQRSTAVTVADNAPAAPQTLLVTGTGVGIPQATLSPSSLAFGSQNITTNSAAQNIVLSNPGTDTLNIASVVLAGAQSADFAVSGSTCGTTLAPGANCSISVTFTPTGSASRGASLIVTDNAGNLTAATQTAVLSGTGVPVPVLAALPASLTFAAQNLGTVSSAQLVQVSNTGTGPLAVAGIALSGPNAADFAQTSNCGQTLLANATCSIAVTFAPAAAGTRTATLTLTDNTNNVTGSTQSVALSGVGQGVPQLSITIANLNFGNQNINTASAVQAATLTNGGGAPLTIASIAIGGTNAADFSLASSGTCPIAPNTLAAGASCSVGVLFTPKAIGSRSASVTLTDNAGNIPGSTQVIALTGVGNEALGTLSATSLTFASTNLGVVTAKQTVTLTNTGNIALAVSSIALTGTNSGDFAETNTCGTSVAAGASCSFSVTFTPQAIGVRSASIAITDNNANTPGSIQTIKLSGTGMQAPVVTVTPTTLPFGSVNVQQPSTPLSVTLKNSGEADLLIASITFAGTNPADFSQTNNCSTDLPAGSTCVIQVTFTPAAVGARSGTMSIKDNNNNVTGAIQTVTLTGTGLAPKAVVTPTTLAFTSQSVATSSAAKTVTLTNSGTENMTITAIAFAGTAPGDYSETDTCAAGTFPATLNIGASCTISVTFSPTTNGSRPATLVITDNSAGIPGSIQSITITGSGQAPEASVTPATLTWAATNVGVASAAQTVTLKNSGSLPMTLTSEAIGGTNPGDFLIATNTCGTTLAANASCSIGVKFLPTSVGARTASLVITDNANNAPGASQTITLNGTGQ